MFCLACRLQNDRRWQRYTSVIMRDSLIIGTRKSPLAIWQSEFVKAQIERVCPNVTVTLRHIVTMGDKTQDSQIAIPEIGGKGLFTFELEESLRAHDIDLAVHSLKDLPTTCMPEFAIGAIPERGAAGDVLIAREGGTLNDLPSGAVIGTSSVRRSSQILRARPDLRIKHIRGNVATRIKKLRDETNGFDAIVLAHAGVERLGLQHEINEVLPFDVMLPAPGQGALGVQCRSDDSELLAWFEMFHDVQTAAAVGAERSFLAGLAAGCNTPVAAFGSIEPGSNGEIVVCRGRCLSPDGTNSIEVEGKASLGEAIQLGEQLAAEAKDKGFDALVS